MEKSLKEQLQEIKELHKSNELTTKEYQQLRQSILAGKQDFQQHSEPEGTLIGLEKNLEIGPAYARFLLLEELGRGGMASVWKARDLSESKRYGKEIIKALKFLHPDFAHSKAHYKRLQREADNAKKLRHPNIVAVYSFEQGPDGFLFLVMDYLKGRDLEEVLVDEGLGTGISWQRTQTLMTPVAEALNYAHKEHGIIHRDIKPGNLFLTDDNKVKVLDFGLAEQLKLSGSQLGMQVDDSRSGTKHYWAPEICNSGKLATTRDVYAFTAVVYELLTECPPYPDKIVCDRPDNLLPQKPENISNAIWKELQKGLAYYAEQRPDNIQAFWNQVISQKNKTTALAEKKQQEKKQTDNTTIHKDKNSSDTKNSGMSYVLLGLFAVLLGSVIVILLGRDSTTPPHNNEENPEITLPSTLNSGAEQLQQSTPVPKPATYALTIKTIPVNSTISINGEAYDSNKKLPSGRYEIKVEAEGYKPIERLISITKDKNVGLELERIRLPIEPEMIAIPKGKFTMGCVAGRDDGIDSGCDDHEKPKHKVNINGFKLAKYEVTNAEYVTFLNQKGRSPDKENKPWLETQSEDEDSHIIQDGKNFKVETGFEKHPVIEVSWYGAKAYADWLNNEIEKATGAKGSYRLPTEAEWEYAARAGSEYAYSWGNDVGEAKANCYSDKCKDNYEYTAPVGSFAANPFRLHDMHGNVWEWVEDRWHSDYKDNPPADGSAWNSGESSYRVIRGGSWDSDPRYLRSAARSRVSPDLRNYDLGFRLASGQE